MRKFLFILILLLTSSVSMAAGKAALVKLLKGEAFVMNGNEKVKLKVNDWVDSGATIHTSDKSFLKLVFIDKSQMNVGASSQVKIEKFHRKDAGVIDLVRGKIRSQVSKDYLQIQGKNRSKLFIKTPNAVMGIRGTDFLITTTGKRTAAVLFEGEVVFNRLSDRKILDSGKLDDIVDRGVRMYPGEFSAVGESGSPTIPALLNVHQRERLEKNGNFNRGSDNSKVKSARSVVPGGLSGNIVASKPIVAIDKSSGNSNRASANPDAYRIKDQIKPANGSFVNIDTARIIAPAADSILDKNTNTYITSGSSNILRDDGSVLARKGMEVGTNNDNSIRGDRNDRAERLLERRAHDNGKLDMQIVDRATDINDTIDTGGGAGIVSGGTTGVTGGGSSGTGTSGGGSSGGDTTGTTGGGNSDKEDKGGQGVIKKVFCLLRRCR